MNEKPQRVRHHLKYTICFLQTSSEPCKAGIVLKHAHFIDEDTEVERHGLICSR